MDAEITTRKVETKWYGYVAGRPELDETALTEEAVGRKMEQLRDRIGTCGARTKLFGGRTCELIAGHHELGEKRNVHRSEASRGLRTPITRVVVTGPGGRRADGNWVSVAGGRKRRAAERVAERAAPMRLRSKTRNATREAWGDPGMPLLQREDAGDGEEESQGAQPTD